MSAPFAHRVPVPARDSLLSGGDGWDYADAFAIQLSEPDGRSAEELARRALDEAPWLVGWAIWLVHSHLLRLRLGPRSSPDHVLGWTIVTSERDVVQLEAVSPVLSHAVIVGRRPDPTSWVVTTRLFYTRPAPAHAMWTLVGPLHRRAAPYLLERAARSTHPAELVATVGR